MKITCLLIVVFIFAMHSASDAKVTMNQGFNSFVGFGVGLTPGTFRVGSNQWEGGMISPGVLGAVKNFSWTESTYSSFGFGVNSDGFDNNLCFQSAVGFEFDMFWNLGLRGEFMARANFNGTVLGNGLLGISYGF